MTAREEIDMILKFELNQKELAALSLTAGEEILYAVPYDCDLSGNYVKNAFTVVTNKRLVLLRDAAKEKEYDLSEYEAVKAEPRINCGVLYAVKDGQDYLIFHANSRNPDDPQTESMFIVPVEYKPDGTVELK